MRAPPYEVWIKTSASHDCRVKRAREAFRRIRGGLQRADRASLVRDILRVNESDLAIITSVSTAGHRELMDLAKAREQEFGEEGAP